jgi:hypothetical protein
MNIIGIIVGAAIALGLLLALSYMNKDGKAACVNAGCACCGNKDHCHRPDVYEKYKAEHSQENGQKTE